jgi:3-hydroxyisobutyrate dehydrogenase
MVGASDDALARWRKVLEPLSSVVIHTGAVGTGSAAKLLTNLLWFTHVVALSDGLAAAVKCGITPATMRELVPVSAGASWVSEHDMPNILAGNDDQSFTLALCCKDLALISALCGAAGAPTVLLQAVQHRFRAAAETFGLAAGELAVARLSEAAAGVSIRDMPSGK